MLINALLLSASLLGSTLSALEVHPRCDGLIEPSVLSIDKPMESYQVNRGDSVILKCSFYASPQPSVSWYRGSKLVDHHPEPHVESFLTTNQLGQTIYETSYRIDCVDDSTAGEYFCEATTPCSEPVVSSSVVSINRVLNSAPSSSSSCPTSSPKFLLPSPPYISAMTISRIELPGGAVQLSCRTRGSPAPIVTWRQLDELENIVDLPKDKCMQLHNGDLVVVGDESSISDTYRCFAKNSHGVTHADSTVIYMTP